MSLVGERVIAPLNVCDCVEGTITQHDEDSGYVTLVTDDGDKFQGYEYMLETISE